MSCTWLANTVVSKLYCQHQQMQPRYILTAQAVMTAWQLIPYDGRLVQMQGMAAQETFGIQLILVGAQASTTRLRTNLRCL